MRILTIIAFVLTALSAQANYFKAGLGYNLSGNVKPSGITSQKEKLDSNFLNPMLLAYGFDIAGDVFGEAELSYSKLEYKDSAATAEPTVLAVAFNAVGRHELDALILTGGAGLTYGMYDPDNSALDSGNAFGLQVFGGADFKVADEFTIGAELRYRTTVTKADHGKSGVDLKAQYDMTALMITAKFGM